MSSDAAISTPPVATPYREVLRLAWPASVAASVTPLLGAIDVWALGRSSEPLDIAAVGLGSVIFSLLYWAFGFIRMSVAGLTAQADGAGDEEETRASLVRGAAIAGGVGALLVVLMVPIGEIAERVLALDSNASARTLAEARTYFDIRIWGAPFALATYAAIGWLSARGRTDYLMIASVAMTVINIVLDYIFVVDFDWGAGGVAAGTLIAEIAGFVIAFGYCLKIMAASGGVTRAWSRAAIMDPARIRRTISVNFDIFVRTALLAFSFAWFTQRGGAFGDVTLAANQVLLQLFLFTGLALDGTAIAAETLVGRAVGDPDRARGQARFNAAVKASFAPALIAALCFTLLYAFAGESLNALLTPPGDIRITVSEYLPWVVISPLIVVIGFQLDGIFIGATKAREMRDGMIASAAIFIAASILLAERFGNHGLWAAFSLYFLVRAATLAVYYQRQQLWRRATAPPRPEST